MTVHDKKTDIFQKIVAITLLLTPILQIYGWGKFNFSFIITTILCLINLLFRKRGINRIPKALLAYFVFCFFSHAVNASTFMQVLDFGTIRMLLILILFYDCIKLTFFVKVYRRIAFICILFFFIQEICYYLQGVRFIGIIPYLPIALNVDSISSFIMDMSSYERSSSFFSEPAHFAQFLLPLLAIELLGFEKKNWISISIITTTLILTRSGNALFGIAIIIISYIIYIYNNKHKNFFNRLVIGSFSVVVVAFCIYYFSSTEIGKNLMQRQETITNNSNVEFASSGFIRIWRGYYVFDEYDIIHKIIGNDNPDYLTSKINNSRVSRLFDKNDRYFNGIQQILVNSGYIGLFIFVILVCQTWKQTNKCGKTLLSIMIMLSLIASTYFSPTMIIPLVISSLIKPNTNLKIT